MPQSLSKLLVHIIFSTKERYAYLSDPELRAGMHAYLAGAFNREECPALLVGGPSEHVHVLCLLGRTSCLSELLRKTKRSSSLWAKERGGRLSKFGWQNGYGAFSIGQSQVDELKKYILGQEEHHRRVSFQDELREFLRRYEVPYDERYIWE
jgi:putative transposase